jgi:hypothetical protein
LLRTRHEVASSRVAKRWLRESEQCDKCEDCSPHGEDLACDDWSKDEQRTPPHSLSSIQAEGVLQAEFWDKPQHNAEGVAGLDQIKGFITALPIEWTKGENVRFEYPTALVADKEELPSMKSGSSSIAQNTNSSAEVV